MAGLEDRLRGRAEVERGSFAEQAHQAGSQQPTEGASTRVRAFLASCRTADPFQSIGANSLQSQLPLAIPPKKWDLQAVAIPFRGDSQVGLPLPRNGAGFCFLASSA